jgi:hypothetical protein
MELPTCNDLKTNWDWQAAFQEAIKGQYASRNDDNLGPIADVVEVIAAVEGEHDGAEWLAVVRLADGRYAVVAAGCDYTGWDCQAGGSMDYYEALESAVSKLALTEQQRGRLEGQLRFQEARGRLKLDWDQPTITIEERVTKTIRSTINLNRQHIIELLKASGVPVALDSCVCFQVPGGGDYSNTEIEITDDDPIIVRSVKTE